MESNSGTIRIPEHLEKSVLDKAHELILSWAYHRTRLDHTVEKHHTSIIKLLTYYNVRPLENYQLKNDFVVKVNDSDLPKSYFNYAGARNKAIRVIIDSKDSMSYGYYVMPNIVAVCTKKFYATLSDTSTDEDTLARYINDMDSTLEHELTHFVQDNYLHKMNTEKHYDMRNFNIVDYYTSHIEFDPTIKSELNRFASEIVDNNYSYKNQEELNDWIRKFTVQQSTKVGMKPSKFFEVLKEYKPEMYKRAVQIFTPKVNDEIAKYIKFKEDVKNTEADRLDYTFGKLRLNQFTNFVRAINTFIDYPSSRLQDFKSMSKYLDNIPKEYKENRKSCLMFVRCQEQVIKKIADEGKSFSIDTIFVEDEPTGTGMMFELPELPMILDIAKLTRDNRFVEACEYADIKYVVSPESFAIVDGTGFKFKKKNIVGIYVNGEKQ